MSLTRKRRPKKKGRIQRPFRISAYQRGHIDGFQRGKDDGFHQGRIDASKVVESPAPTAATAIAELPPGQIQVLVITAGIIPSLEIGIIQPFNELRKGGNFEFELRTEDEVSKELIAAAHTIVFLRNVEPVAYSYLE